MIKLALLDQGIREEDIHIAIKHGISDPKYLNGFLQSGAKTTSVYNILKQQGFDTVEDKSDYEKMESFVNELQRIRGPHKSPWFEMKNLNSYGEIFNQLQNHSWNPERLEVAARIYSIANQRVPFEDGYLIVDALQGIELPDDMTLSTIIERAGITNLLSWVLPTYEPELVQYAINSPYKLNYKHARATFDALKKKEVILQGVEARVKFSESFLQEYGLGWANSDMAPHIFVALDLVRKSHGRQIPLSNLLKEIRQIFPNTGGISTLEALKRAINEDLSQYCVVLPNEIVQMKGRKRQPVDNETAFEQFKEKSRSVFEEILKQRQINPSTEDLVRTLSATPEDLPDFFNRVAKEEIHAIRLSRVIRDGDLPQACQLVWRYFVSNVSTLKPKTDLDEDDFVHDIDFATTHLDLNKAQVSLLHDIRKIRNEVEHPSNEKSAHPTWEKVSGVLKICELF